MRKIVYSVAMSLDGFIAGPAGEFDWIPTDPDIDFAALFGRFDTVLMGRRTYEVCQGGEGGAMMPAMRTVVASRTLRPEDHPAVTVVGDDLAGAVGRLRAEPGKDVWLFGGGVLFRGLLELGLVDEVGVAVVPILLGSGLPFLPETTHRARLRLVSHHVYPKSGILALDYAVENDAPP